MRERYPGFAFRLSKAMIVAGYARQRRGTLHPDITRFARDLRVTRKMVYLWVHAKNFPRDHLGAICAVLKVKPDDLLHGPAPRGVKAGPLEAGMLREAATALLAKLPEIQVSTGYPEVDVMVVHVRAELTQIWEQANEQMRQWFLDHFARQVTLFRQAITEREPPPQRKQAPPADGAAA